MVQAAEHHTATGHRLERRQAKPLADATTTPVLGRVVQINRGAIEQSNKVLHPARLHLHAETRLPQSRHQLVAHIATALTGLHQHVDRARLRQIAITTLQPGLIEGIRQEH